MEKRVKLLYVITLLLLTSLTSCKKDHFFVRGNGDLATETRQITDFDKVTLEGYFNVFITQDTFYRVEVEAESNFFSYISTCRIGDELIIRKDDFATLDANLPINVYVFAPDIEHISLTGSGKITTGMLTAGRLELGISGSGNINADCSAGDLTLRISGSGNMDLYGSSTSSQMFISGSGNINAYNLVAQTCHAEISGSGNMYLNVIKVLDVRISGSGSVFYKGTADLYTHITGSGSVVHVP